MPRPRWENDIGFLCRQTKSYAYLGLIVLRIVSLTDVPGVIFGSRLRAFF